MNIGAHISIAGGLPAGRHGIQNAPERASVLGCEIMQIFTRSPRGGKAPELTKEIVSEFKILNTRYQILDTYIHTPYYINFASLENRIRYGSVSVVRDELERGSLIGAKYVMTHLGSAKGMTHDESIQKVIEMLQKTLENYTGKTKLLLENSAGAGEIIGSSLLDLKTIIDGVGNSAIAGICLDTQHSFASGYDWRDFKKTITRIDQELGLKNIKLIHANDSLTDFDSKRDRHEHIGDGKIGKVAFQNIVAFAEKNNIDMILETEHDAVEKDIELLKSFRDNK
ncbi:MAG: deoxyribonuclease IV [Candidatus Moranbacteria bacterium]|nr:deoxyribonuclease IV [Candidatus Moranbacteria bacterium]